MSLRSQIPKTVPVSFRGASAAQTNKNETTIPSLVSELRGTFLTRDFDRVEHALLERESRLVAAIQEKDKEIASLKVKNSIHSLDKLTLESQLKEFRNRGSKVVVEVKKEEHVDSDSSVVGKCMHCLEMKNDLEKEKGVNESLKDRNMQLEFEKSELLEEKKKWDDQRAVIDDLVKRSIELEAEKCGLLEEKKKWKAAKSGIDGLRKEESDGADEASVEYWKRKFIELSERVSRLERETAENEKLISLDDDGGGGGGGDGSNSEENTPVRIDESVEKDALERNENVGLSSRDSATLIIPCKDGAGVTGASAKGSLGAAAVIRIDSDEDECNSQRTLQMEDSKRKVVADNVILSSSGAVKRKQRLIAAISDVGRNNDVLDDSDCDAASNSCSSSSGSLYDMDQLPLSSLTSKKRMRIGPGTFGSNSSPK